MSLEDRLIYAAQVSLASTYIRQLMDDAAREIKRLREYEYMYKDLCDDGY